MLVSQSGKVQLINGCPCDSCVFTRNIFLIYILLDIQNVTKGNPYDGLSGETYSHRHLIHNKMFKELQGIDNELLEWKISTEVFCYQSICACCIVHEEFLSLRMSVM